MNKNENTRRNSERNDGNPAAEQGQFEWQTLEEEEEEKAKAAAAAAAVQPPAPPPAVAPPATTPPPVANAAATAVAEELGDLKISSKKPEGAPSMFVPQRSSGCIKK